jgi:hypothetical protein
MKMPKMLLLLALLALASQARADILITQGPGNVAGDENILFNEPGLIDTGTLVEGVTNNTGFIVNFLGTQTLTTPSGGQARIEAETGTFNELTVSLDALNAFYTSLIVNLNAADDGQATIQVFEDNANETSATFDIDQNGQNFFIITAINSQLISSVKITTTAPLDDVRQIRMGGAVPEPSAIALALSGLVAGVGYWIRKR